MIRTATALLAAVCIVAPVSAQVQRAFPQNALRGTLVVGVAPDILLNGERTRLAPGSRVRDANNMVAVPSTLIGGPYLVHYTLDTTGLVRDVWILRPDEAAVQPWPSTLEQAQAWSFDPVGQVWSKP
ncbi:MAG TPA: hypothetical protein VH041_02675 [Caldimonas sp.]|jgi:hypothetical protein|nr:hypothetical protein [Caldimonas sp.]HEX4233184.1 hypothetical protein [Caldimonas sp.]